MNIGSYFGPENVILDMEADDKKSAIAELVDNLVRIGRLSDPEELIEAVVAREELCTTGLENGVAIPLSRLLKDSAFRKRLLDAPDAGAVVEAIAEAEASLE
ncbi:MAG: PTS sugar transporter subunit IIA [bacterium]|nr:PTS sugar transporter subunit IIA [bacterium]